jgi:hypothetical protein
MPLEVPPRTSRFGSPLVAGHRKGDNDAEGQKGVVSEPHCDPILMNRRCVAAVGHSRRFAPSSEPTRGDWVIGHLLSRSNSEPTFQGPPYRDDRDGLEERRAITQRLPELWNPATAGIAESRDVSND